METQSVPSLHINAEEILLSNCINRSLRCEYYKKIIPKIVFLVISDHSWISGYRVESSEENRTDEAIKPVVQS
jgi:hypothetical protein